MTEQKKKGLSFVGKDGEIVVLSTRDGQVIKGTLSDVSEDVKDAFHQLDTPHVSAIHIVMVSEEPETAMLTIENVGTLLMMATGKGKAKSKEDYYQFCNRMQTRTEANFHYFWEKIKKEVEGSATPGCKMIGEDVKVFVHKGIGTKTNPDQLN